MNKLKESELVLHPDGSIYHLKMRPEHVADDVIVVGDPGRVKEVSKYFDTVEIRNTHREMVSHTGYLNNKRITVLSTGMGPDNIDIVMNELDALVNIDLQLRTRKEKHTSLNIVRLGTSGALQAEIPVDSFVMSTHGVGMDGLLYYYKDNEQVIDLEMTSAFIQKTGWPDDLAKPYIVPGASVLMKKLGEDLIRGMTATAPGFYAPQGRELRLRTAYPELMNRVASFTYGELKIINLEMETATLYGLGKMLGHQALTICLILANRATGDYSKDYKRSMDELIQTVLARITMVG